MDIKVKNREIGEFVFLSQLWQDAGCPYPGEARMEWMHLQDMKAMDVFYERLKKAESEGQPQEVLDQINSTDVRLNLWDVIENELCRFRVWRVLREVKNFMQLEMSDIAPDEYYYGGA